MLHSGACGFLYMKSFQQLEMRSHGLSLHTGFPAHQTNQTLGTPDWWGEHCMANTADQNRWREVRVRRWNVNREVCENFFDPICKRPVDSQEPDWKCGRTKKKKDPNRHKTSTLAAASRLLGTIWILDVPENPGGHRTQRHCTEVYIPLTPQTLHLWKCTIKVGLVSCVNNKPCCKVKGACRFLPMQFSASAATPSQLWVFDTVLLIVWIQTFKTA